LQAEKPIEAEILNQYFKQIAADDTLPPPVIEALLQLRKEGQLKSAEKVQAAIRNGINVKS
jgi:hypothetical protein